MRVGFYNIRLADGGYWTECEICGKHMGRVVASGRDWKALMPGGLPLSRHSTVEEGLHALLDNHMASVCTDRDRSSDG